MNKKVVFLPYDMDTAIGINNEGALVFGYNLEDTDQVGGADVYNGQNSVLWCNLRDCFGPELKAMYQQLRSTGGISYATVEQMFEEHQAKWPEAIFNEDAFFKYIQPLIDDGDETYLSMLQGSKAEQRKWWLYNRFRYLDSKYNAGDSLSDYVQLRGYALSDITLTPYADIYATIRWASTLKQERAERNVSCLMRCPLDGVNDTEIYIYSAGQIADVGDLSGLKVGLADFHSAVKLRQIILGSTASGYANPNLRSISVGNLKLLRKIDVRNCTGLGSFADQKVVDLSGCSGIEEVYFDGTVVLGVSLPNGGLLKKLHLPGTITNLTIRNQTSINEFVCPDFSHVSTLNLENSLNYAQVTSIVGTIATGCRVRLVGYTWDFADIDAVHDFLDLFDNMTGLDQNGDNTPKAQLILTVRVPSATGDQIDSILDRYPDITVEAEVATYNLRYYNTEGTEVLYTETLGIHQNGSWNGSPSHAATAQYNYVFVGWSTARNSDTADINATRNITGNRKVYAAYAKTVRTYTVYFKNDNGTILATVNNVPYGGTATYNGATPVHSSEPENMEFTGFLPTGENITENTSCIAQYNDTSSAFVRYLKRNLEHYESQTATKIGYNAFYQYLTLKDVVTNATIIEDYAFNKSSYLETVDFTNTSDISIGLDIFNYESTGRLPLKSVIIRSNSLPILKSNSSGRFLHTHLFTKLDCVLYVPHDMVDAYKVTAPYSEFSTRIYSIDDYPVTNIAEIKDSFSAIKAAIDDESFFNAGHVVGDSVQLIYGEHTVYVEIIKIDSVNKYADFLVKNYDETIKMHDQNSAIVAYSDSFAKARLDEIYENELPSDLKAAITPVSKTYHTQNGTTETVTAPLWLLNSKDLGFEGAALVENEGETYPRFSGINRGANRIKFDLKTRMRGIWWTGSGYNSTNFLSVNTSGSNADLYKTNSLGLVFGFRIQKSI